MANQWYPSNSGPTLSTASAQGANTVLSALAHEYRRAILASIAQCDGALSVAEAADHVAKKIEQPDGHADSTREHIAVALHHCHLPLLASADILEYNPESNVITPGEKFSLMKPLVTDTPL